MTKTNVFIRNKWVSRDTLTAEEARAILDLAKEKGIHGPSKVNRVFTKRQSWDILSAAVESYSDDQPINPLIAKNIFREFSN